MPLRCTYMLKSKPSRDRVQCRKCGEPIRIPNRKPQRKTAEPAHPESKHSGFPIFPVVVVLALLIGGGIAATQVDFRVLLGGKTGTAQKPARPVAAFQDSPSTPMNCPRSWTSACDFYRQPPIVFCTCELRSSRSSRSSQSCWRTRNSNAESN